MLSATPNLPSRWLKFLSEVDSRLPGQVKIHCVGGFVITLLYGLTRTTADIDYIEISPANATQVLQDIAGPGSEVHKRHGLYFQHVGVASIPESYNGRLIEPFPRYFRRLRLLALEPHDLALSKLARNSPVDQGDVKYLAETVPLDREILLARYKDELRPIIIGDPNTHDQTMKMWLEVFFPTH